MSIFANGGALSEFVSKTQNNNCFEVPAASPEILTLSADTNIYTMALPFVFTGNSRINYLNNSDNDSLFFKAVCSHFRGAETEEGFDAGETAELVLVEDFESLECPDYLIDYKNPRTMSWNAALTRILQNTPIHIEECFERNQVDLPLYENNLTKLRLASHIICETCKWLIECKEIPRIRNARQALVYLLSSCPFHNRIGKCWFARSSESLRPRSWWARAYPGLAYFWIAQEFAEEPCVLLPAYSS
ncbi:hypothetical protein [Methylobacterium sp. Leaf113]|uniref:hypothetical protein n=1 Tax=Methylobacterium sp. Leaf113 TaxID=1736259 RepID=UPI000A8063C3|nr:hypothetical protein [Methylobacterium sp. Leaf113]